MDSHNKEQGLIRVGVVVVVGRQHKVNRADIMDRVVKARSHNIIDGEKEVEQDEKHRYRQT